MTDPAPAAALVRTLSALQGLPQAVIEDQGPRDHESRPESLSGAHIFSAGSTWHGWRCSGGPGCAGAHELGHPTLDSARTSYEQHVAATHGPQPTRTSRTFVLQRDVDHSGVSGTGVVADGCLWPDGTATIRWRGPRPSTVHWQRLDDAIAVHGHGGATRIIWTDEATEATPDREGGMSGQCPTCADTLTEDDDETDPGTVRIVPDAVRRQYADAIRAASWAPATERVEATTRSVLAVRDRAMEVLYASLTAQRAYSAELGLETRDLRERITRARAYAESRVTAEGDNTASASWILDILDGTDQADGQRPVLPRRRIP
ncbi:hypothetical protein ABZ442_05030 [Streptomyces triculaminicus]|uniref:hypothetical protein n=1 Tax=Streptomyces triculaminicus TaxID=2816232 RepID=UPI003408BB0C